MIKFKYTKANGDTSDRIGIVLASPSVNYSILDLSDLPETELDEVNQKFNEYQKRLKELRAELEAELGISVYMKRFKAFKPAGITDVENI